MVQPADFKEEPQHQKPIRQNAAGQGGTILVTNRPHPVQSEGDSGVGKESGKVVKQDGREESRVNW